MMHTNTLLSIMIVLAMIAVMHQASATCLTGSTYTCVKTEQSQYFTFYGANDGHGPTVIAADCTTHGGACTNVSICSGIVRPPTVYPWVINNCIDCCHLCCHTS